MCGLPRGHFRRKAVALRALNSELRTGKPPARITPSDVARATAGEQGDTESINSEQFALIMDKVSKDSVGE